MDVEELLQRVLTEERNGNYVQAVKLLRQGVSSADKDKLYLLSELGELYYRGDEHLKSIQTLILCYRQTKIADIADLLLYRYYEPNKAGFKQRAERNKKVLTDYAYFYGDLTLAEVKIIWLDKERIIYFQDGSFYECYHPVLSAEDISRGKVILIANCFDTEKLQEIEKKNHPGKFFLWAKKPLYLYYSFSEFQLCLQLMDIEPLTSAGRIVFLVERLSLEQYLLDGQSYWPEEFFNINIKIDKLLDTIKEKKETEIENSAKEVKEYYSDNWQQILSRLQNDKIRILFLTSRFTTVLQYHAENCCRACAELGLESKLYKQKSDINTFYVYGLIIEINKFKPDIIFCLDHFRFEYDRERIPREMIFVTWIQDVLPLIVDSATPGKLGKRDFVLQHLLNSQGMIADYSQCNVMDALIPGNEKVYKEYALTAEEAGRYGCDICLVCHASNFTDKVNELLLQIDDFDLQRALRIIAEKYFTLIYNEEREFFSRESHQVFLREEFSKAGIKAVEEIVTGIAEKFYLWLRQCAFRICLVRWLLEAGYTNIKLWGSGWENQPEFAPYAMGTAENGEILSKIYQASKINIGNNIMTTGAARAWESIFSGGFYLSNYIPPEYDVSDIRTVLKEDEEIKFFYNKKDLLEKVAYYLSNEEERKKMIKKGKERALEKMTFTKLMERTINFIKKTLTENKDE